MESIIDLRKKRDKQTQTKISKDKDISWDSDYSIYTSPIWQKSLIFFLVIIVALFVIFRQGQVLITFFSLLLFVFILHVKIRHKIIKVSLSKGCLQFGERIISYQEIESFWIIFEPRGLKELSLRQKSWHSAYLKIPINNQNPIQIRNFLLNYIPEERHEDSIFDILGRKFGI